MILGLVQVICTILRWFLRRFGGARDAGSEVRLAHQCAVVLRDLINPYLLRRQKKDLARIIEMPGKTEHVLFCRLTPSQRALYRCALDSPEVRSSRVASSRPSRRSSCLARVSPSSYTQSSRTSAREEETGPWPRCVALGSGAALRHRVRTQRRRVAANETWR